MNFLWATKLKAVAEVVWTVSSLICVPALIGVSAYWTSQGGTLAYAAIRSEEMSITPGEVTNIDANISVATEGKTVYRIRLIDSTDHTVCVYPDVVADKMPTIKSIVIKIPNTLHPGAYRLVADVFYAQNPIRTNRLVLNLAKLTVEGMAK